MSTKTQIFLTKDREDVITFRPGEEPTQIFLEHHKDTPCVTAEWVNGQWKITQKS